MSIVTAFSFEEVYVEIPTNVNRLVSRAQPFIGVIQIYQEPLDRAILLHTTQYCFRGIPEVLFRIMLRPAGFRLHSFTASHLVITV